MRQPNAMGRLQVTSIQGTSAAPILRRSHHTTGNIIVNAQYIVISHNDSVIAEADTLYGISMNEGISKVTSLKI